MRKAFSKEEYTKREKLISDTAMQLLQERKFANITMRELAKSCNMAIGTLFNYYPTKELLLRKLLYESYDSYFSAEIERLGQAKLETVDDYTAFNIAGLPAVFDNHALIALLSIHHDVFTAAEDTYSLSQLRLAWGEKLILTGSLIHGQLPRITQQQAVKYYYFLHALLVGYNNLLEIPGMNCPPLFSIDEKEEIRKAVSCYCGSFRAE